MSDASLLAYVKSIDTSLKDIRRQHTEAMLNHINSDDVKHAELSKSVNGLKTFRTVSILLGLATFGGGTAVKAGVLDSIVQAVLK